MNRPTLEKHLWSVRIHKKWHDTLVSFSRRKRSGIQYMFV